MCNLFHLQSNDIYSYYKKIEYINLCKITNAKINPKKLFHDTSISIRDASKLLTDPINKMKQSIKDKEKYEKKQEKKKGNK